MQPRSSSCSFPLPSRAERQKSLQRPFLSQSLYRVGSGNRPPRRGPPHSRVRTPNDACGSTNISSSSTTSSSASLSASFVVPQLAVSLSLPADVEGVGLDEDKDEVGVAPVG
jgi:hypothetical protein